MTGEVELYGGPFDGQSMHVRLPEGCVDLYLDADSVFSPALPTARQDGELKLYRYSKSGVNTEGITVFKFDITGIHVFPVEE